VYVRSLVPALAAAFPGDRLALYAHRWRRPVGAPDPAPLPAGVRLHRRRLPAGALALAARAGLGADRVLGGVDVMHWTDYVPLETTRARVVATIHDVCFVDLPEGYTEAQRRRLVDVTRRIVARAERVIVPSVRTRDDLARHFAMAPKRIDVVPHGCRALPEVPPADDLGRYVLFVGTLQPRKNVRRLIEAFDAVQQDHADVRLVLAGAPGWLAEDILSAASSRPHVVLVPDFDAARLSALYRGALAVALPSLGEGFGLPVLEAMHVGRALLVGHDTACADLAGEAALAVAPTDADEMTHALLRLIEDEDLRAALGRHGRARAAGYTWARTARATHAVYEKAIHS